MDKNKAKKTKEFAAKVAYAKKMKRMTNKDIAAAIGCSPATVTATISGYRTSVQTQKAIADVLGFTL